MLAEWLKYLQTNRNTLRLIDILAEWQTHLRTYRNTLRLTDILASCQTDWHACTLIEGSLIFFYNLNKETNETKRNEETKDGSEKKRTKKQKGKRKVSLSRINYLIFFWSYKRAVNRLPARCSQHQFLSWTINGDTVNKERKRKRLN